MFFLVPIGAIVGIGAGGLGVIILALLLVLIIKIKYDLFFLKFNSNHLLDVAEHFDELQTSQQVL